MSVDMSIQNSEVDSRRQHRELDEPPQTACSDSVDIPVAVPEAESGTQQGKRGDPLATMVDRLCGKAGHHHVGCRDHSEGHYRHGYVVHSTRLWSHHTGHAGRP